MKKDSSQNLGIIAIGLGLLLYIAADQGLFEFAQTKKVESVPQPAAELARATSEIKQELQTISKGVSKKQSEVEDLTSRLSSLKLEIAKRARELRQIDPRVMSEAKTTRKPSSKPRHYSETSFADGSIKGRESNDKGSSEADQTFGTFSSIEDLHKARTSWKLEDIHRRTSDSSGRALDTFSFGELFASNSIYLTNRGLRWAQLVSKLTDDLGNDRIEVTYSRSDKSQFSKAVVLRDYLAEFVAPLVVVALTAKADANDIEVSTGFGSER